MWCRWQYGFDDSITYIESEDQGNLDSNRCMCRVCVYTIVSSGPSIAVDLMLPIDSRKYKCINACLFFF